MDLPQIGQAILAHRKSLGLTQQLLAKRSNISRYTLIKLEKGRASDIQLKTLMAILAELGLTLDLSQRPVSGVPIPGEKVSGGTDG